MFVSIESQQETQGAFSCRNGWLLSCKLFADTKTAAYNQTLTAALMQSTHAQSAEFCLAHMSGSISVTSTSPVPGGMSMTSMSSGAHETLVMKESRADMTMGPLHTAGASSYTAHQLLSVSSHQLLSVSSRRAHQNVAIVKIDPPCASLIRGRSVTWHGCAKTTRLQKENRWFETIVQHCSAAKIKCSKARLSRSA